MDKSFEKLLTECLAELDACQGDIERCLRKYPGQEEALRPYLEFRTARSAQPLAEPSTQAEQAGREALVRKAITWSERRAPHSPPRRLPGLFARPAAVLTVAVVLVMGGLVAASGGDILTGFQFGASTTQDFELEGTFTVKGDGWLVIGTQEGSFRVRLTDDTVVVDEYGNILDLSLPELGSVLAIKVRELDDGTLVAISITVPTGSAYVDGAVEDDGPPADEVFITSGDQPTATNQPIATNEPTTTNQPVATNEPTATNQPPDDGLFFPGDEVEFLATITSISGTSLTVETDFGSVIVTLTASTDIDGTLAAGVPIKVHATRQADGSFLAREIDVVVLPGDPAAPVSGDECNSGPGNAGDFILEVGDGEAEIKRGTVLSFEGNVLMIDAPDGPLTVIIDSSTDVEGNLSLAEEVRARGTLVDADTILAERVRVLCPDSAT